jgi:membrane protein YqaA with SNARE-associated domain
VITALAAYLTLFLAAFLAATIVPAQSEAVLVGLILSGDQPIVLLLV